MTILVVGADRLGSIPKKLKEKGIEEVIHWTGRERNHEKREIPERVGEIIVFCDFIKHNLVNHIKKQGKQKNIPITFAKRSLSCLDLDCLHCCKNCPLQGTNKGERI